MTPKKAIRKKCVECAGSTHETKNCRGNKLLDGTKCYFFDFRDGVGRPTVKTVRKFCLHCMGDNSELVKNCPTKNCILHQYRFGKNPARTLSPERKRELVERFARGRAEKQKKKGGMAEGICV